MVYIKQQTTLPTHSFKERYFQASKTARDLIEVLLLLSVPAVILFACDSAYIVGFVSLVKETFQTCVNHCKN